MAGIINSQPIGVKTIFDAPSVTVDIAVTGNNSGVGLSQWYYSEENRYSPNRYGTGGEPITLHPVINAVDPEMRTPITPSIQTVTWTEIVGNGTRTPITNTKDSATATYVVKSDGSLLVKKNVPYNAQVSIECVIEWKDPRNGDWHTDSVTANLKTNLAAEAAWTVEIAKATQRWNPLSGMSSTKTVTARAMKGKDDKSSDVTFRWYYYHNGSPVLVDDTENPCLAYVSGQGTDTITVDCEYETETLTLMCRIASGSPLTEIANAYGYASIVWSLPQAEGMAYSNNGDTARKSIPVMTFGTIVQAGGDRVSDNILASRTRTHWTAKRDSNGSTVRDLGWGREITMKSGDLMATDGSRMVVTPEIHVLSPYKAIYYMDGSTRRYLTQTIGGVEKLMVSKVID